MKCPICNTSISIITIRDNFKCPKCNNVLSTTNLITAIIVSLGFWFLILTPITIVIFDGNILSYIADAIVGSFLSILIFKSVLRIHISSK